MLQVWPFFHTQHGSHLWQYFPEGFIHLLRTRAELIKAVRAEPGPTPDRAKHLIDEFRSCNALSLDGLQRVLNEAGFTIQKTELLTKRFTSRKSYSTSRSPFSVSGVKLLATSWNLVDAVGAGMCAASTGCAGA